MKSKKYKLSAVVFYSVIIALALVIPNMAFAGTIQLPQTGQTKCYDTAGTQIPCAGTGQDGEIQAGVAWPNPRFIANADTTITDNLTGLVWAPDGNLMKIRDPGWDNDSTAGDGAVTWQHALDYLAKLNNENYLSHSDWRLPNVNELESLMNAEQQNSAVWLNGKGFTNVQYGLPTGFYWSSTTGPNDLNFAWQSDMWGGYIYGYLKTLSFYVWPVRSGETGGVIQLSKTGQTTSYYPGDDGDLQRGIASPSHRFTDNINGTVIDNLTGLMWTKNASLSNSTRTWQQALNYVKTLNIGEYTDWRLPNKNEMRSLFDYSQQNPALTQGHPFINVQTSYNPPHATNNYWTSTTSANNPDNACYNIMWGGNVDWGTKSNNKWVWPVRSFGEATVINLSSFTATPKAGKVIFQWSTESEIDNAGFNLYRSESENGDYININSEIIPAQGSSTQGASYEYVDADVQNRKTYYYKLEDIDLSGNSTMHGPKSATPRLIYGIGK